MRYRIFLATLVFGAMAVAKEPKAYLTGTLLQMNSVQCVENQKGDEGVVGDPSGTDADLNQSHRSQCPEYVLQSDNVIIQFRPRENKHAVLLPIGSRAEFRLEKNKMLLRMEGLDSKEREFIVISMKPRTDASSADAGQSHLNHLQ